MKRVIQNLLPLLLVASFTLVSSVGFALMAQNQSLDEIRREYDTSFAKRSNLAARLQSLEKKYRTLVSKVDALKRSGSMKSIAGRLELEDLLRQSKSLADDLAKVQKQIRSIDGSLESSRQVMVKGLEREMSNLEKSLASAKPSSRGNIVNQLNSLRRAKLQYAAPLPEVPNAAVVDSAIRDADQIGDDPDALTAVADELQDTEDQLRARVKAIEGQLSELKKTKSLLRRADSFSKEERFFEEGDRARVIAKYEVSQRTASDENGATSGNANVVSTGNEEAADLSGNNGAAAPQEDADFASANAEKRVGSDLSDSPSTAERAANQADPFETTRSVRIDGGGDPSRAIGSNNDTSNGSLNSKIRSLESEKRKLRKQADELEKRAKKLRKRAKNI